MKRWRTVFAAVSIAVGAPLLSSAPTEASATTPEDAGEVVIVDANNRTRELSSGDDATVFSFRLPEDAVCPGDSANDDWRIQSFLVPESVDPGAITYGAIRPDGDGLHSLRRADTRPWVQEFLAQNPGPGEPGLILEPPPLIFGIGVASGGLIEGTYRVGVVCTLLEQPAQYWDTRVAVKDTSNPPSGFQQFQWETLDDGAAQSVVPNASSSSAFVWIVPMGAAALLVVALLIRSRRPTLKIKDTA